VTSDYGDKRAKLKYTNV